MWVLSRSDWPTLINLSVVASVGYQQVSKFDPRVRLVATTWEAEHLLADCDTGDEAKAIVLLLAQGLRQGTAFIDLNQISQRHLTASDTESNHGVL
jgi:hypothetical protein